jgi:hypothetical protein
MPFLGWKFRDRFVPWLEVRCVPDHDSLIAGAPRIDTIGLVMIATPGYLRRLQLDVADHGEFLAGTVPDNAFPHLARDFFDF